jgi:hypothetical protein
MLTYTLGGAESRPSKARPQFIQFEVQGLLSSPAWLNGLPHAGQRAKACLQMQTSHPNIHTAMTPPTADGASNVTTITTGRVATNHPHSQTRFARIDASAASSDGFLSAEPSTWAHAL